MVRKVTAIQYRIGTPKLGAIEDTIEIIDECDSMMIDDTSFAEAHHKVGTLIGFTATPLKGSKVSSEKELLDTMGLEVHDSAIPAMGPLPKDLSTISWENFMSPKRSNNARLVYLSRLDRIPPKYKDELQKPFSYTPFDHRSYRQLAPNSVTLVCWRQARGVDFRAIKGCGIDLLIAHQLPNERALVQLLGRVGRYGQDCSRWKLEHEVDALIDEKAARICRQKFREAVEKARQNPQKE